ncbi:hypothetical protein [Pseudovibrio brasiliensis]|nr:hypothetical protein [Pseudovibrio brasiliensis]
MLLFAYVFFVALPVKYLPIPGFRAVGEPLEGGWQWGDVDGCFDDIPVMQFVGNQAYLVVRGERIHHIFRDITTKADGDYYYLEGEMNLPNKPNGSDSDIGKTLNVNIKFYDRGKSLLAEEISSEGEVATGDVVEYFSMTECGYPYLSNYLLRLAGIRNFWKES